MTGHDGASRLETASSPASMTSTNAPDLTKVMDLLLDAVCVVDEEGRYVFVSAAFERIFGYSQDELIGRLMIELVHPDDREGTLAAAAEIMDGRPKMHFENRYVRKDGRVVNIMWSARWSPTDRLRFAVARDVTALKRAEAVRNALYQISEAANAADGITPLYQHIERIVRDLLPMDRFLVALYDPDGRALTFPDFGQEQAEHYGPRFMDSYPLIARVIRAGQSVIAVAADPESDPSARSRPSEPERGDWLGCPLMSGQEVVGALVVQGAPGGRLYTADDKELLQFISSQVAAALLRKRAEADLRHMAGHDPLTDLPNRTFFHHQFDQALERAAREYGCLALLYLDLDGFKVVNDTFGHEVGDRLLCEAAERLQRCIRASDTIGRIGGDEFTVMLTNLCGPEAAGVVAAKIRDAVARPFDLDGTPTAVSVSIGIAVYPRDGRTKAELFRHADAEMYRAKRTPSRS